MKRKKSNLALIEKALDRSLARKASEPPEIHKALRYAVLGGGKRFRPALVLSACEAVGGDPESALPPACAVEFVHGYSLIHDDLPALDNDDFRRGKPACHRQFGEAIAILAGDALLTRAFELLSEVRPPERAVSLIRELSSAAGTAGMIGGQVADILHAGNGSAEKSGASTLDYISTHKTGRLIQASAVMGAIVGTRSEAKRERLRRYGGAVGLAFQVVDDIIDGDGYLRLMNLSEARKKVDHLLHQARQEVRPFGRKGEGLLELANLLLKRSQEESPKNVPVA